jgi:hypothetical protein
MTNTFGAASRTKVAAIGASSSSRVRRSWRGPVAGETTLTFKVLPALSIARLVGHIEILDGVEIGADALI